MSGLACALLVPQAASAKVIEIGDFAGLQPSCPTECRAIGKVTTFVGSGRGRRAKPLYRAPSKGKVVALTIPLGSPTADQAAFFTDSAEGPQYSSPPQVRVSILRPSKSRNKVKRLNHRLMRHSELIRLDPYFGTTPTFALEKPLPAGKGTIIAISTPTWVPNLAVNVPGNLWWRSSRDADRCKNFSQDADLTKLDEVTTFGCTYFTERPLYSVTFIPDPVPAADAGNDN